ncbi:MAG: HlyD family efflux transporter periplasmic adaptor subunit [Cyanobacteriota bacterium]|nr:HlyD family efflux transporter periplasmic adaptor subunit [Cyanobacteriota bacterium]
MIVSSRRTPSALSKCSTWWIGGFLLAGFFGGYVYSGSVASPATALASSPIRSLTALGYLKPSGDVIQVGVPSNGESNRIEQLLVEEGEVVEVGQVIAILDSREGLEASLAQAQAQWQMAKATLAQVEAGAKEGEIRAQAATIERIRMDTQNQIDGQKATVEQLAAELIKAQVDQRRYEDLYQAGAIAASERDRYGLAVITTDKQLQAAQAQLNRLLSIQDPELQEARATLEQIAEVRPVDVQVAASEVQVYEAAMQKAQAELNKAFVKALQPGRILEIHAYAGEVIGSEGILEIGQTQQMAVMVEVYEAEIGRIKVGQPVQVFTDLLPEPLIGKVDRIGWQVKRQNVINSDPSANIDARVVEVWVNLDESDSQKVKSLTHLQVTAEIQL